MLLSSDQIAHFKFSYVKHGQAPDALLSRAEDDARKMFLEPDRFTFYTVLDLNPGEDYEPEPGLIDVVVMASLTPIQPAPWYRRILPHKHASDNRLHMHL